MTQWLLRHGVRIASAFQPGADGMQKLAARLKRKRERDAAPDSIAAPGAFEIQQANLVHYLWDDIYRQFGFIKTEVLRDDPNGVQDVGLSSLIADPGRGGSRQDAGHACQRDAAARPVQ